MDNRPDLERCIDAMTDIARVAGRYYAALLANGLPETLAADLTRDWHACQCSPPNGAAPRQLVDAVRGLGERLVR